MADYTKTTNFLAKDSLPLNNAAKYVKGSEIDAEFNNLATADADNLKKSALGTSVETALGVNVGSAGAPVLFNGAGGTPSSMTGTNITGTAAGLTAGVASAVAVGGITGLGTGVATALAVNVGSAGAPVVLNGALGTPSSGTLTNATGLPAAGVVGTAATLGANTFTAIQRWAKGADVASANALSLGVDGNYFDITGVTSITSIGTLGVGTIVGLHFDGALTLTHHVTDLILPGAASISTAAGDEAVFVEYASGDWRCLSYTKASGQAVVSGGITLGSPAASTSGVAVDFTGIPSTAKRVCVMASGVSTSGTSALILQIGDSGGFENTSYEGSCEGGGAATLMSSGFMLTRAQVAAGTYHAVVILMKENTSHQWMSFGSVGRSDSAAVIYSSTGGKTLSATLDSVRITTAGGTDTFDAGEINITYE